MFVECESSVVCVRWYRVSALARSEEEEKKDVTIYKKKAKNFQRKLQVLSTLKELSIGNELTLKCVCVVF